MENTIVKDEHKEYEEAQKIYEKLSPNDRKIFENYLDLMNTVLIKLLDTITKEQ